MPIIGVAQSGAYAFSATIGLFWRNFVILAMPIEKINVFWKQWICKE
jgi:hypothetical protein